MSNLKEMRKKGDALELPLLEEVIGLGASKHIENPYRRKRLSAYKIFFQNMLKNITCLF